MEYRRWGSRACEAHGATESSRRSLESSAAMIRGAPGQRWHAVMAGPSHATCIPGDRPMRFPLAPRDHEPCSFCDYLAGRRECAFVVQGAGAAALVDVRQYERGAMLVIPRSHRESILDITDAELDAVYRLARQVGTAAVRAFGATGVNVYQNNG